MTNRFTINSTHQSFTNKQNDLFNILENAEKTARNNLQNKQMQVYDPPEEKINLSRTNRRERRECGDNRDKNTNSRKSYMKQYKSRESIFKRPEAPIGRCLPQGRVPGFRKNPNQWTRYTLEDVKDEDLSDRSNTQAAFAFLKSLEKNKPDSEEESPSLPEKIVFKKSTILKKQQIQDDDVNKDQTASFRSSKLVMPEYVVGQSTKPLKKKKLSTQNSDKAAGGKPQLKLNHLDDFDEDSEDI